MRVAVLTCDPLPEPDPDEAPLIEALRTAGARAEVIPWDRPEVPWHDYERVVVRATWDYHRAPQRFLTTLARIDARTTLLNPLEVIRWNHHKRYLLALAQAEVPVVPTTLVPQGGIVPVLDGGRDWVVKPAISGSSWETRRVRGPEADAFLRASVAHRDTLVQPALPGFETPGELSLIVLDGHLSHAVRKQPRFAGDDEHVGRVPVVPDAAWTTAERALRHLPRAAAFARVDLVWHDERYCVSELEAIEPSLFLAQRPHAARVLAACIVNGGPRE